jgi:hypothetical protein
MDAGGLRNDTQNVPELSQVIITFLTARSEDYSTKWWF